MSSKKQRVDRAVQMLVDDLGEDLREPVEDLLIGRDRQGLDNLLGAQFTDALLSASRDPDARAELAEYLDQSDAATVGALVADATRTGTSAQSGDARSSGARAHDDDAPLSPTMKEVERALDGDPTAVVGYEPEEQAVRAAQAIDERDNAVLDRLFDGDRAGAAEIAGVRAPQQRKAPTSGRGLGDDFAREVQDDDELADDTGDVDDDVYDARRDPESHLYQGKRAERREPERTTRRSSGPRGADGLTDDERGDAEDRLLDAIFDGRTQDRDQIAAELGRGGASRSSRQPRSYAP